MNCTRGTESRDGNGNTLAGEAVKLAAKEGVNKAADDQINET